MTGRPPGRRRRAVPGGSDRHGGGRKHEGALAASIPMPAAGIDRRHFGKSRPYYYALARGIDERPVRADRIRKAVGADLFTREEARAALEPLIGKVWSHCEGSAIRGRTATLKARYVDFRRATRSRTVEVPVASRAAIAGIASALLEPLFPDSKDFRLLSVTLSSLVTETGGQHQLGLPI